jgi:hypothetical protein
MAEAVKRAPKKVSLERANQCVAVGHKYYKPLICHRKMLNYGKDFLDVGLDLLS